MPHKLTIVLSDDALEALRAGGSLIVSTDAGTGSPHRAKGRSRRARASQGAAPRAGSLPARISAWAKKRKTPFGPTDVMKKFKVERGHASMLLTNLTNRGLVKRIGRGVYEG